MSTTLDTSRAAQVERLTLEWVATILEEPQVSPEDNFLDLGGHSTLAVLLTERAKERFGIEYDLLLLFEKDLATVAAELADRVTAREPAAQLTTPESGDPGTVPESGGPGTVPGGRGTGPVPAGRDAIGGGDE